MLAFVVCVIAVNSVVRQQVHCDDGTVWIISLDRGKALRFNADIDEPTAVAAAQGTRFDVAQSGDHTLLVENGGLASITASTLEISKLDAAHGDVMLGGGTVAALDTRGGNLRVGNAERMGETFSANSSPVLRLWTGGKAVVDRNGTVWAYRPRDGMVFAVTSRGSVREVGSLSDGERLQVSSFTVVDGIPVVLADERLIFPGGEARLDDGTHARLQAPPTDDRQSGWVAVAMPGGITMVKLHGSNPKPVAVTSLGDGLPAQPVSSGGCVHAAFSQSADNYIRVCSSSADGAAFSSLDAVTSASELTFRTNHRHVVLNDVRDGTVWNPQRSTDAIDVSWDTVQVAQREEDDDTDADADNHAPTGNDCEADATQSERLMAVDDEFGVRPSSRMILDVLRNDERSGCSALRIDRVGAPSGGSVRVTPIQHGRYLQLDASELQGGSVRFSYEVSDGHGRTSTAQVRLDAVNPDVNHAPLQVLGQPEYSVEQGGAYTTNVLDSFTDPDGDPLTLVRAEPRDDADARVHARADGRLTFSPGSSPSGRVVVEITVSDGKATGTGLVSFSIRPAGSLPADLDSAAHGTVPGETVDIDLAPYIHATGAQRPELVDVEQPENTSVSFSASGTTLSFTAAIPGTYHVPYTVRQGRAASTGMVRVDVEPASREASAPVTSDDVAMLVAEGTALVEPLANDTDPTGGVLSVTSVSVPANSGVSAVVVDRGRVRVTARQALSAPVGITYTAANTSGSSIGSIIVHPARAVSGSSLIRADDFTVGVRCGGTRTVAVLDHVLYDADDGAMLQGTPNTDGDFRGEIFASDDSLRYRAPERPGEYSAVYTVVNDAGESVSATVTFSVHRRDAEGKRPPNPRTVEARTTPGGKVRIPIPLTGIDEDGDDVLLLGLGNEVPQSGRITETGADYLVYEAFADANGTDSFTYAVEDWSGRRSQAKVRVGVASASPNAGVTARDDAIALRPGADAMVPVLANDVACGGGDLTLSSELEISGLPGARVVDNHIAFTAPTEEGTGYAVYTVRDEAGMEGKATLTVRVDRDARILAPRTHDYRVPAQATVDRRVVEVDLSDWISNPSGTPDELAMKVASPAKGMARLTAPRTVAVELADEPYAVPYTVTNTTHGVSSTAFIHVPAYGSFPPTARPDAPELSVAAGQSITITVADHVRVGAGKKAYADRRESVVATKGASAVILDDGETLRFTAPSGYAGLASMAFTAVDAKPSNGSGNNSDGTSGSSSTGDAAVIMLTVMVTGRSQSPPAFPSTTIDMAPGDPTRTIDLNALTTIPYATESADALTYSGGLDSSDLQATVSKNGRLKLQVAMTARTGTTVSVPLRIHAGDTTVDAGLNVRIVTSSRPLARIPERNLRLHAGDSQHVDMLADAYNPFPDTPLTVTACSGAGDGVTVTCGKSGTIEITAARGIATASQDITVTVEDATGSSERTVSGILHVRIADAPAAPALLPTRTAAENGAVTLFWEASRSGGVLEYEAEVRAAAGVGGTGSRSCGIATTCTIGGLSNGNRYEFRVRARNDVGWSSYSNTVFGTPDAPPGKPTQLHAVGGRNTLTVSWRAPSGSGSAFSAPTSYLVSLTGSDGVTYEQTETTGMQVAFGITDARLSASSSFGVEVRAVNGAGVGERETVNVARGEVYGEPERPVLALRQDASEPNLIRGSIVSGDMRGNRCAAISIDRDTGAGPSCAESSFSFMIDDGEFFSTITVTATIRTDHGESIRSLPVSITPVTAIGRAEFLDVDGSDGVCTMRWRINGKADGVKANLHGVSSSRRSGVLEYTPEPWTPCETGTVTPTLNGESGATMISPTDASMNRPPAHITTPASVRWDGPDHVIVRSGNVDTYGQSATVQLVINDIPFDWMPAAARRIDVSALPAADSYRWSIRVVAGDARLNARAEPPGNTVEGTRTATPSRVSAPIEPFTPTKSTTIHKSGDANASLVFPR
nr:tandem-95 repeat protein [Bifidobacterium pongonis]